jgi:type IV secretion system protein VirD4
MGDTGERRLFDERYAEYKREAEQGDAAAQWYLGHKIYSDNSDIIRDLGIDHPLLKEGREWLTAAAEQGYAPAQDELAGVLIKFGVDRDMVIHWRREAAKGGDGSNKFKWGVMLRDGDLVQQDKVEAAKWFREAATLGHTKAEWFLGLMLRDGNGIPRDIDEALKCFREAAEKDTLRAAWDFGIMLRDGDGIARNADEAVCWLKKATEWELTYNVGLTQRTLRADPVRMYDLGVMLRDGMLVRQNRKVADELFRQAAELFHENAEKKDDQSLWYLGVIYRDGLGVPRDDQQAAVWFRKAAKNPWAIEGFKAQVELGVMLRDGIGVARNRREAARWFLQPFRSPRSKGWGVRQRAASELLRVIPLVRFIIDAFRWARKRTDPIHAWLRGWCWSAVWGEVRTALKREKWVADLSESDGSYRGIGGGIRTASETAVRGKALMIGLWFAAIGLLLLVISVPPLMTVIAGKSEALGGWFWPIVGTAIFGTAIGAYWFFGRGLGPIQSALSWSRISSDTHGKARWATLKELRRAGLAPRTSGIYLGRFLDKGAASDTVGYPGPVHLITIGPNNAGKGTGLIIQNLASLERSIFIIDPKGEAAAITARKRAKFGPVKIINPFNVLVDERPYLRSGGFNPLAALDPGHDNFTDDCVSIAQALVKEGTGGNEAFFSGSAQDLVTALVMHEKIRNGKNASLANVRKMLTEPFVGNEKEGAVGLLKTILDMTESQYEPLRSKAGRFVSGTKSTLDIISTASNETRLLDSPALQRDLSGEAINWDSMKEEITTVYLILPSDRLETHANFLRLVVTSALRSLLRSPPSATLPPVLFMLDECAQLGYLPPIENAMGIARGFGVQLWTFWQDLNQLHALYKDRWQTFIGARGVLTAFAPKDMFTADYLSKLCGNKTVIVESENVRADSSVPGGGRAPQGVPLIRPEELMGMPAGLMLCFAEPVKHPFITKVPGYWNTWFAMGLDDNPYHRG